MTETDVKLRCKNCGNESELKVRTKNQLDAHLRKGRRCRAPFGPIPERASTLEGETCNGEIEVVEPEQWRDA